MGARWGIALGLLLSFAAAPTASAYTEAGDRCLGDDSLSGWSVIIEDNGEFYPVLPPLVPPESGTVITSWTVRVAPGMPSSTQKLVIYRHASEGELEKVAESDPEAVSPGENRFTTRLVVPEYARIGLYGSEGTLFCNEEENRSALMVEGDPPFGVSSPYGLQTDLSAPVTVTFERAPPTSGGGGDAAETECTRDGPRNPEGCPEVALSARAATKRNAILVAARVSSFAPVSVSGKVAWRARGRRVIKLRPVGKDAYPKHATRFWMKLPRAVLRRLASMKRKQSLKARISVVATDRIGVRKAERLVVKLHGRKRAQSQRGRARR